LPEPERQPPRAGGLEIAGSSALVTGGAGFIGSHLVDGLLAAGARSVHVLDDLSLGSRANLAGALARPEVELTLGDVADAELLERIVSEEDHSITVTTSLSSPCLIRSSARARTSIATWR
jgi:nucleoside-diphosphate-sugar epimerase